MFALLCSLIRLLVIRGGVQEIALENLALRQQLTVFKRRYPRPRLRKADRWFWLWLSRTWKDWRRALIIVPKPWCPGIARASDSSGPGAPEGSAAADLRLALRSEP